MPVLVAVTVALAATAGAGAEDETVRLWPGAAPGTEDWNVQERTFKVPSKEFGGLPLVTDVTVPTLTVVRPDRAQASGTAVIVCPGGGFQFLGWEHEGMEVARWLAQRGITAFVLKYRVRLTGEVAAAGKGDERTFEHRLKAAEPKISVARADAIQAIRYLRSNADMYGIARDRIGTMGFSAGAMTTMSVVLKADAESRPDFAASIYGAMEDAPVPKDAPPLFIVHTQADALVPAAQSTKMFHAWTAAERPAELHLYQAGPHGLGMRKVGLPVDGWTEAFEGWLRAGHLFDRQAASKSTKPTNEKDVVGIWKLKYDPGDGQTHEPALTITKDGLTLKAEFIDGDQKGIVKEVRYKAGELQVKVETKYNGETATTTYTGKSAGDALKGDAQWEYQGMSGTFPFQGKRELEKSRSQAPSVVPATRPVLAKDLPISRGIRDPIADVRLTDSGGKSVRLLDLVGGTATVIAFIATGCPVGDLYLPRLGELAREYGQKGVNFIGIDSSRGEAPEEVTEHMARHGAAFRVLMDGGHVAAGALKAERTCETLVIDADQRLRYRGAIDDQYTRPSHRDRPTRRYLAEALDSVLAGREVAINATPVSGCPIEGNEVATRKSGTRRVSGTPLAEVEEAGPGEKPIEVGRVTYAADVATILQQRCQECHRPGQVAPFTLLSYDDARRRSAAIREVVEERRMPPWHADPRHGKFSNDRQLTAEERAKLVAWVAQDCPLGDAKRLPTPRKFPEGWVIGTPDVVIEMPEPYVVKAEGTLPYQTFRVPTNFKEDTWVQAIEVRPGEASVVHHITVAVADPKAGPVAALREQDQWLGNYVPGFAYQVYPEGTGKLVPAGSVLVVQVHYTPIGLEKTDRSKVGLMLAKVRPRWKVASINQCQIHLTIPPGASNHEITSQLTLKSDTTLLSLRPHMHLRGKDFKIAVKYPNGASEVLVSVPVYDFGWQEEYQLTEPKRLPKGTRIDCVAHFDNSADNPANPDPTKTVQFGMQTDNEMMCAVLEILEDVPPQGEDSNSTKASIERKREAEKAEAVSAVVAVPGKPNLLLGSYDVPLLGYQVEEFFVSGTAISYKLAGKATEDGKWDAVPSRSAPYTTRIVVVRPSDPSKFSGTVVAEWINVSGGLDVPVDWNMTHREILRRGHAFVAVSAQKVGLDAVKRADGARYERLTHPGDAYSFDIFSQAGKLVKDAAKSRVIGSLVPQHLLAIGESQSAFYLTTYATAVDPVAKVYDGILVHSRFGAGAPLDGMSMLAAVTRPATPLKMRPDLRVPVLTVVTESDVLGWPPLGGSHAARQPDAERLRVWEVAGTAHADNYVFSVGFIDSGSLPVEKLAAAFAPTSASLGRKLDQPMNFAPQHHYVVEAALWQLDRWVKTGKAAPSAPPLKLTEGKSPKLVTDANGLAEGGLRTPWVDVPTAVLSGAGSMVGSGKPFDAATLERLYPGGKAEYLKKFDASLDAAIAAGFIVPEDKSEIMELAALSFNGKGEPDKAKD
jgi:acetyl esterase/lipase